MRITGYNLDAALCTHAKHVVYRGSRIQDGRPVLIKVAAEASADPAAHTHLDREYQITRTLSVPGLIPVLDLVPDGPGKALILEDAGGRLLSAHLEDGSLDLQTSLSIALQLAAILASLHQRHVVHEAVHPKNILVHPETGAVWLTGLDQATQHPEQEVQAGHNPLREGPLAYISPEQTGRMNRSVDYRSDFYALGVTLYEMLTGRLPFEATDPLELVHAHIARAPVPPDAIRAGVPQAVSGIVLKLLAKTAEERYQSAQGLRLDLEACLGGEPEPGFVPGAHDVSDRFQVPQKLYGRAADVETLMAAFDRVNEGATELLLVSGYSGIGKSALVHVVHRPINRRRGYFVSGKFDQYKRNIPYSAIITAFQELVRQLLAESEAEVDAWRGRLLEALGPNGQVIVEVIPEVELIIGPQPAVPDLPPTETQNRFNLVFERFLKVFAQQEHPLVLFLDDLQWADSATLQLLRTLATDPSLHYLLVLGAFRDNEVDAAHPLTHTLAEIEAAGAVMHALTLSPLGLEDLTRFVADTLQQQPEAARPLAELVRHKTNGNPFFVIQFLKSLYQEGLVTFDYDRGGWRYDLAQIRKLDITDNVVDLMVRKIQRLSEATQGAVKLAACIGNAFDLYTLSIVSERGPEQAAAELEEALHEGLILPASDRGARIHELKASCPMDQAREAAFRYLHDRVQQAAYSLILDADKAVVHLRVGRLLLQHCTPEMLDERLFDIVGHLNTGAGLIEDREERTRLAGLNLQAGRKAKSSTAYQPALAFFTEGIAHLPPDAWQAHYDLAFALHLEQAECDYLCGHFDKAERELDHLLELAHSPLEQAEIYRIRIVQYENTDRFPEARDWGKRGLALFGIVFPDDEAERRASLDAEVREIDEQIGDRRIEDLVGLPVMTDEAMRMSMKLLMTMWAPSYISGDMMLTVLIAARMVNLSLTYGNVEESAYGYITYAIAVGPRRGDFERAYDFGRLALKVNERFDDLTARAKVNHMFSCYIGFWRKPIASCFPHSREAYRAGLESGDFIYAAYGAFHESWHALFSGYELGAYHTQYTKPVAFLARAKYQSFLDAHRLMLQWGLALQGHTHDLCSLTSDDFDEAAYLATYRDLAFFANFYYVAKLTVLYHCGAFEEAARVALQAESVAYGTRGMIWDAWLCFYHAMTLAARHPALEGAEREAAEQRLDALCTQLAVWSEHCPENFVCRHQLVRAEQAAIQGDLAGALTAYERAIAAAGEYGFIQIEALANECFARFWLRRGNETIARLYLTEAHRRYGQWGASAKVRELEARYRRLLAPTVRAAEGEGGFAAGPDALDLSTVTRAAQVISGALEQRQVLGKLMQLVMENAGAGRGLLLLERGGRFVVEAAATAPVNAPAGLQPSGGEGDRGLASTIVQYVARVGESAVLGDAAADERFGSDPYIDAFKPLSILCTPILHKGKTIGILYLENNLARDAFTPDRLEVVHILASQAAISLENARLYEELQRAHDELERRVEERTDELSRANTRLQQEVGERRQVELKLQEAKEAAEAANRAKSEFLANMSHELRTPLNGILGYAQILKRGTRLTDAQRTGVNTIERSGEHLLTLINDILDLSKIEAGKLEVQPTEFQLLPFLESIADMAQIRAEQKGLAFRFEATAPLPGVVRGDERRLRQVLLNLLGNAVKFTDQGSVLLRAEYGAPSDEALLRIAVEDTGIGIIPDELTAIFEPFHQVQGPDRLAEGTGLGLAISQKLVRLMGGVLYVESTPGAGSTFRVELALPETVPLSQAPTNDRHIAGFEGAPRRVLVVDDKYENRAVLVDLLEPLGFEVEAAVDGQAALARAKAFAPHVVLMDLVMPVMDGFEAVRQLRKMPELEGLVVIALSASVFEHSRQRSKDAGCDDFVPKPVKAPLLLDRLGEHLGLTWIYAEEPSAVPMPGEAPAAPLVAPTAEQARALRDLAMCGDILGIRHQLSLVESQGEEYAPFVTALRRMADDFDMEQINDFVTPYIGAQP